MDNRGNEFSSATWVYRRFKRKDFPRTLTKPLQSFLLADHVKIANHKKKHQHLTDESPKISQSIQFFQPLEETVQLLQLQDIKNCCSSALKTAYFRATQIRKHYFGNFILIIFVIFAIT